MLVVTGSVQSNYMRTTAAAAAKLGMACHLQFVNRLPGRGSLYHANGNVLLDQIFGPTISTFLAGEDKAAADASIVSIAGEYRATGRKPHLLTLSADAKPLGVGSYMRCAAEMLDQFAEIGASPDAIVVPSGSAATHVGVLLGPRTLEFPITVHDICVWRDTASRTGRVLNINHLVEILLCCGHSSRRPTRAVMKTGLGPAMDE